MSEPDNLFSGQSLERLTALSDGLFAVAMTLLVLDVRVPVTSAGAVYPGWPGHGHSRARAPFAQLS